MSWICRSSARAASAPWTIEASASASGIIQSLRLRTALRAVTDHAAALADRRSIAAGNR
ncbi:MAG: hypothetical protein HYY06_33620 [Deltaproteobacteria bacterium]|nr:hypothetical protein [Deltaproteobacteria bacterium]